MNIGGHHHSKNAVCPICSGAMTHCFSARILGKYDAQYEVCSTCHFLRVSEPHWLDEAYASAIAAADTGLVMRNISITCKIAGVLYWVLGERGEGRYLDVAGGYGMLTRLMRDFGFDFYWADKYCDNKLALGFEYSQSIGKCRAITAMEVFEHLVDPAAFVEETLALSGAETLIFTTELYEGSPPLPDSWWYYAFATGQHIGFFQRQTLEVLGARLNLQFVSANGIHILSKSALSERQLNLVTGRWVSRVAPWWTRLCLGSKTMADHKLLLQKYGNRN